MNQMGQLLCQALTFPSCVGPRGLKHSLELAFLGSNPVFDFTASP